MSKTIDARGLSCPQPLILTTRAMKEPGSFTVIVDNVVARENIVRMLAERYHLTPRLSETGRDITIQVER